MTTTTRMVSFGYDPDTVVIRLSPLTPFLSTGIALWGRLAQAHAKVAELADAPDLGSGSRKALGVRLPPFALLLRSMKTEFADVNETRKTVRVEIPTEAVTAEIDRIAKDYSRKARIPGFRPGK